MKHLTLPLSVEERKQLRAGDAVLLSGTIYTARDAAHKRLVEMIEKGEKLPFNLENATIYYVGPTPNKPGQVIGSAGPTTSGRMDSFIPILAEKGLTGMIGKGRRNQTVIDTIKKHNMIYFVTVGGAGALLSKRIVKREMVAFEDLLAEAVTKLEIQDFPCFVGIDTEGNDIYD